MAFLIPDFVRCTCEVCGPRRKIFIEARLQLLLEICDSLPLDDWTARLSVPLSRGGIDIERVCRHVAEYGPGRLDGPDDLLYLDDESGTSPFCVAGLSMSDILERGVRGAEFFVKSLDDAETEAQLFDSFEVFADSLARLVPMWRMKPVAQRVLDGLALLRRQAIAYEEPDIYNTTIRQLKIRLSRGELGVRFDAVWCRIQDLNLGLITSCARSGSEASNTTASEAILFLYDLSFAEYGQYASVRHTTTDLNPAANFFCADINRHKVIRAGADSAGQIATRLGRCIDVMVTPVVGKRHGHALQCAAQALGAMRRLLAREPHLYNDYMRGFKERLFDDGLFTHDEANFWKVVQQHGLGLVTGTSLVTDDEARRFLHDDLDD